MSETVSVRSTPEGDVLVMTSDERPNTDGMILGEVISSRPIKIEEEFAEDFELLRVALADGGFCGLESTTPYFSLKMSFVPVPLSASSTDHD